MAGTDAIEVDVIKAVRAPVAPSLLQSVLRRAASVPEVSARLPANGCTLALQITDDNELRRLNRVFSGEDTATDVLSFPGVDGHLGDLAISWPAVLRQAKQYAHPALTELALLSVHGLLHLLGWDHATRAEHDEMARITRAALSLSGLQVSPSRL